jgi:hypothetical protein
MSTFQLAQLNIAKMSFPMDAPEMADFVANLERINGLADAAPGFVWRLQTEDDDTTGVEYFGADSLVNLSVWENVESLQDYVYRTAHAEFLGRRREWFARLGEAYVVLWWLPAGTVPSLAEAKARLELLRDAGPNERAFTFRKSFPAPSSGRQEP